MSSVIKSKQVAWTLLSNAVRGVEAISMDEVEYTIGAHANDVSIVAMSELCDNVMMPPVKAAKTEERLVHCIFLLFARCSCFYVVVKQKMHRSKRRWRRGCASARSGLRI